MASNAPKTVLIQPEKGVTIYAGGKHGAFEQGRAIPLPEDHAASLIADGVARLHQDVPVPAAAPPQTPAPAAATPAAAPAEPAPAPVPTQAEVAAAEATIAEALAHTGTDSVAPAAEATAH